MFSVRHYYVSLLCKLFNDELEMSEILIVHEIVNRLDVINSKNSLELLSNRWAFSFELLDACDKENGKIVLKNFKSAVKSTFDQIGMPMLKNIQTFEKLKARKITFLLVQLYAQSQFWVSNLSFLVLGLLMRLISTTM